MRVAFLAGQLSRHGFGVSQVIESLSGALAKRSIEIKVFGIRDPAWTQDAVEWKGADAEVLDRFGPDNFGFTPGLTRALRDYDPDILHLHGIWMYSSAVAAGWAGRTGRPLVISPHGMLAPAALSYSPGRKRIARALYQDRCFARASGYLATGDIEKANIRAYFGDARVTVVPHGVEETSTRLPVFSKRRKHVLAIGRLHPVKGYDRLLRAWSQVEDDFSEWTLEIAGPDSDGHGAILRALIEELGLSRANIGEAKFGVERDASLADARLFVLPSLTENFALTVPEALVCATPVIASTGAPWAALPEQGCGWWVPPEPDGLAGALRTALSLSEDQLATMGTTGRTWAHETFGWDRIAQEIIRVYSKL